jgi:hypothetical protein
VAEVEDFCAQIEKVLLLILEVGIPGVLYGPNRWLPNPGIRITNDFTFASDYGDRGDRFLPW